MLIQPDEPIVRHPCGKPRASAFSPDISWDWLESELDTIAARPQDPYYIREEDKKVIRTKLVSILEREISFRGMRCGAEKAGLLDYGRINGSLRK